MWRCEGEFYLRTHCLPSFMSIGHSVTVGDRLRSYRALSADRGARRLELQVSRSERSGTAFRASPFGTFLLPGQLSSLVTDDDNMYVRTFALVTDD